MVSGVTSGSFALTAGGGLTGAAIESLTGAGAFYTVTVTTGDQNGTLRLDLATTAAIRDQNGTALGGANATVDNQSYTIDRAPPVTKITAVTSKPLSSGGVPELLLSFLGSDAGSGLDGVRLFYKKKEDGGYRRYGLEYSSSPIAINPGTLGAPGDYFFYSTGVDKAGNVEAPHAAPDILYSLLPSAAREWRGYR